MRSNNRKQIKNKLLKVDCLTAVFDKKLKEAFGDITNIKVDRCHDKVYIDFHGECPAFLVYDSAEDGYTKTFKIAAKRYENNQKSMMKVIKILDL